MTGRLQGKAIVIVGAGSVDRGLGNGRAAAIVFAREGGRLLLVDCNADAARDTLKLVADEGGEGVVFEADVSRSADCKGLIDACIDAYGRVDIVLNNVGIEIPGGIDTLSEEDWDRTMAVNLRSVFLISKYAVPHMVANGGGSLINISSINATVVLPAASAAYSASKAAVIALTREIAVQFAAKNVRANAILPGMMNTPMVTVSLTEAYGGDTARMTAVRDAMCPMGRQGEGWDTANVALFLASDESRYVSGASIVVDGALTSSLSVAGQ